jgi:putative transposase
MRCLAVKGLARTRMAKSVHDAGWSAFVAMLEYQARLYGREFHRIGRFEPVDELCKTALLLCVCGVMLGIPAPDHAHNRDR